MNRVSKTGSVAFALALFASTASAAVMGVAGQIDFGSGANFEIEDFSFDVEQTINIGQPQPVSQSFLQQNGVLLNPPLYSVTVYGRGNHRFDIDFADGTFFWLNGESLGGIGAGGQFGPVGVYRFTASIDGGPVTGQGRMTIAATVPEPSTWVMLLMGFGALGFGSGARLRKTVRG